MQILSFLVYFFAWLVGSFRNPFMWGFAAVCAYIAIDRAKWFWPGIVATVYTGFDIFMGYRWWKEIGEDIVAMSWWVFFINLATAYLVYTAFLSVPPRKKASTTNAPPTALSD